MLELKQKLTLIIPCYNEQEGIPNLSQHLEPAVKQLKESYSIELIFVNDGSTDNTAQLLEQYFRPWPKTIILTHEKNKNLGAALRTGFAAATGDFIAVLDSDCTYSPELLLPMLQMMDENTHIITVSPYHPQGKIHNVPTYRIFLSKSASRLYKVILRNPIHTYTAMVRVYRREVIDNVKFEADNFLGVTELLVKAILKGYTVKEIPAELNVRRFGTSKMKMIPIKVIKDHLFLMSKVIKYKVVGHY